jgi:plasmid stability protein
MQLAVQGEPVPSLTIKNIPAGLYERLKESAHEHGRSINNEAIFCLKRALRGGRIDPDAFLGRIESLRSQLAHAPLTDEMLRAAKEAGRP